MANSVMKYSLTQGEPAHQVKPPKCDFRVEQILGLTSFSKDALACHPQNGCLAYPAACFLVFADAETHKQSYIKSPTGRNIKCVTFSKDGRLVAFGESGLKPYISVWLFNEHKEVNRFLANDACGIRAIKLHSSLSCLVIFSFQNFNISVYNYESGCQTAVANWPTAPMAMTITSNSTYLVVCGHRKITCFSLHGANKNTKDKHSILERRAVLLGPCSGFSFLDITCGTGIHKKDVYAVTMCGSLCLVNINLSAKTIEKIQKVDTYATCLSYGLDMVFVGCRKAVVKICDPTDLSISAALSLSDCVPPPMRLLEDAAEPDTEAIVIDVFHSTVTTVCSDCNMYTWKIENLSDTAANCLVVPYGTRFEVNSKDNVMCHSEDITDMKNRAALLRTFLGSVDTSGPHMVRDPISLAKRSNRHGFHGVINFFKDSHPRLQLANAIRVTPDGHIIICGNNKGQIKFYDAHTGVLQRVIEAHSSQVTFVEIMYDKQYQLVCTGGRDRVMFLLNAKTDFHPVQIFKDHSAAITGISLGRFETWICLVSIAADGLILIRRAKTSNTLRFSVVSQINDNSGVPVLNTFTQKLLATSYRTKAIQLYQISPSFHLTSYKTFQPPYKDKGVLTTIDIDPTASFLAAGKSSGHTTVYELETGHIVGSVTSPRGVSWVKFSNDLEHLVSTADNGCVFIWKLPQRMSDVMKSKSTSFEVEMSKEISYETYVSCIRVCKNITMSDSGSSREGSLQSVSSKMSGFPLTPSIESLNLMGNSLLTSSYYDSSTHGSTTCTSDCTCSTCPSDSTLGYSRSDSSIHVNSMPPLSPVRYLGEGEIYSESHKIFVSPIDTTLMSESVSISRNAMLLKAKTKRDKFLRKRPYSATPDTRTEPHDTQIMQKLEGGEKEGEGTEKNVDNEDNLNEEVIPMSRVDTRDDEENVLGNTQASGIKEAEDEDITKADIQTVVNEAVNEARTVDESIKDVSSQKTGTESGENESSYPLNESEENTLKKDTTKTRDERIFEADTPEKRNESTCEADTLKKRDENAFEADTLEKRDKYTFEAGTLEKRDIGTFEAGTLEKRDKYTFEAGTLEKRDKGTFEAGTLEKRDKYTFEAGTPEKRDENTFKADTLEKRDKYTFEAGTLEKRDKGTFEAGTLEKRDKYTFEAGTLEKRDKGTFEAGTLEKRDENTFKADTLKKIDECTFEAETLEKRNKGIFEAGTLRKRDEPAFVVDTLETRDEHAFEADTLEKRNKGTYEAHTPEERDKNAFEADTLEKTGESKKNTDSNEYAVKARKEEEGDGDVEKIDTVKKRAQCAYQFGALKGETIELKADTVDFVEQQHATADSKVVSESKDEILIGPANSCVKGQNHKFTNMLSTDTFACDDKLYGLEGTLNKLPRVSTMAEVPKSVSYSKEIETANSQNVTIESSCPCYHVSEEHKEGKNEIMFERYKSPPKSVVTSREESKTSKRSENSTPVSVSITPLAASADDSSGLSDIYFDNLNRFVIDLLGRDVTAETLAKSRKKSPTRKHVNQTTSSTDRYLEEIKKRSPEVVRFLGSFKCKRKISPTRKTSPKIPNCVKVFDHRRTGDWILSHHAHQNIGKIDECKPEEEHTHINESPGHCEDNSFLQESSPKPFQKLKEGQKHLLDANVDKYTGVSSKKKEHLISTSPSSRCFMCKDQVFSQLSNSQETINDVTCSFLSPGDATKHYPITKHGHFCYDESQIVERKNPSPQPDKTAVVPLDPKTFPTHQIDEDLSSRRSTVSNTFSFSLSVESVDDTKNRTIKPREVIKPKVTDETQKSTIEISTLKKAPGDLGKESHASEILNFVADLMRQRQARALRKERVKSVFSTCTTTSVNNAVGTKISENETTNSVLASFSSKITTTNFSNTETPYSFITTTKGSGSRGPVPSNIVKRGMTKPTKPSSLSSSHSSKQSLASAQSGEESEGSFCPSAFKRTLKHPAKVQKKQIWNMKEDSYRIPAKPLNIYPTDMAYKENTTQASFRTNVGHGMSEKDTSISSKTTAISPLTVITAKELKHGIEGCKPQNDKRRNRCSNEKTLMSSLRTQVPSSPTGQEGTMQTESTVAAAVKPIARLLRDQDDYLRRLKEVRERFEESIQALSEERKSTAASLLLSSMNRS